MQFLSIFDNLDVIKILGIGLSGLSLLLMVLAYRLLQKLIDKPDPNPQVFSLVKLFLGSNIIVLIVVGAFSIPIASKNTDLNKQVVKLGQDKQHIANQADQIIAANELKEKLAAVDTSKNIHQATASLKQAKLAADSFKIFVAVNGTAEMKEQANIIVTQLEEITQPDRNPASIEDKDNGDEAMSLQTTKEATKTIQFNFDKNVYEPAKNQVKEQMMIKD